MKHGLSQPGTDGGTWSLWRCARWTATYAAGAEGLSRGTRLNRVTQRGAGAVHFQRRQGSRKQLRILAGRPDDRLTNHSEATMSSCMTHAPD